MATEFTIHAFEAETGDEEEVGRLPIYDYTDITFDLTVTRRDGTSPTLDVVVQESPLDDDDHFKTLVSFTQVDGNTSLPFEETKTGGGTDYTMPAGARFVQADQTVGGTDPEWVYLLTATVTLFDGTMTPHKELLADRYQAHTDLSDYAEQAEADVVEQYLTRGGKLHLRADELTGPRIREAIARRIEWLIRRDELENSTKPTDGPRLRRHAATEWEDVRAALLRYDTSDPVYMI